MIRSGRFFAALLSAVLFALPAHAASIPTPPAIALKSVTVQAPAGPLKLEVADMFRTREYGLMGRTAIPAATGMIFVFHANGPQNFWMKDTLIPLDMVFVHADGVVDTIAANVPASTVDTPDDKVAQRQGFGKFVIELAAGGAAAAGLKVGTKLSLPPLAVRD